MKDMLSTPRKQRTRYGGIDSKGYSFKIKHDRNHEHGYLLNDPK